MIRGLNEKEHDSVNKFRETIMKTFLGKIESIYLFGSKARGDYSPLSDIDLLVITSEDDWQLADEIRSIGYELDGDIDYRFSIIVIPKIRMNFLIKNGFSFARNLLKEGLEL